MRLSIIAGLALVAATSTATGQTRDSARGRLLYETHCIQCHTEQMHWRAAARARDWGTLRMWVQRWQGEAQLQWTEADIDAVAGHLNETIYRFPRPATVVARPDALR